MPDFTKEEILRCAQNDSVIDFFRTRPGGKVVIQSPGATPWEAEMDRLTHRRQLTLNPVERNRLYDREKELAAENHPLICPASPDVLPGAKKSVANFQPVSLGEYTLRNVDRLFIRPQGAGKGR